MKLELEHIQNANCPECGARWVEAGVETSYYDGAVKRHVNGGTWEFILYACGRKDGYVPNFLTVETKKPCSHSPAVVANNRRRAKAKKSLMAALGKMDLTKEERETMERNIRCALEY